MKLDNEYLKSLLIEIEGISSPRPSLKDILEAMGLADINDEFLLHYEIISDYGFIEGAITPQNIGLSESYDGTSWVNTNIRLTATGHEFVSNIRQSEVWETIKEKFKEDSVDTIFSMAKKLAQNIAKKKLDRYINDI